MPSGPNGRYAPFLPYFWGIWQWAQNQSAAKDLMTFLMQRENVEKCAGPAAGYDIPPFLSMSDFSVWSEIEPPKGTVYNYPVRPHHNAEHYIVASSAPVEMAVQIWSRYVFPSMAAHISAARERAGVGCRRGATWGGTSSGVAYWDAGRASSGASLV